jgi:NAD(P)H-nitrite reductase large subunit
MNHVIIGAGIAGISAAEALREHDASCGITMIGDERYYYRAALSRYFQDAIGSDEVYGKPDDWYRLNRVTFKTGRVAAVDTEKLSVICGEGETVRYDRLLLATGASPIIPDWPGRVLEGICTYRDLSCVDRFLRFVERGARRAVVIGGGILGVELAEAFVKLGLEVHLLARGKQLLDLLFDETAAGVIHGQMIESGVNIRLDATVARFEGESGRVSRTITKSGEAIPCDIVGIAVGVEPDVAFLEASTVSVERAVLVDVYLGTSVEGVYAAGDCCAVRADGAAAPVPTRTWLRSALQGRTAALNMLGRNIPFQEGAFFNASHVFDSFYAVIGNAKPRDPEGFDFRTWRFADGGYLRWTLTGNRVVGAIVVDAPKYIWPTKQLIESKADISVVLQGEISEIDLHCLVPQDAQVLY